MKPVSASLVWFTVTPLASHPTMSPPFRMRPAVQEDIPQLLSITTHYVLNSIATFALEPPTLTEFTTKFNHIRYDQHLPWIVAVKDQVNGSDEEEILGHAYTSNFRPLGAYDRTTELSLYISPTQLRRNGVGTALLGRILDILRSPGDLGEDPESTGIEGRVAEEEGGRQDIRELLAIIAVDEVGEGKGVERFYSKFGFAERGLLKRVGYKFGRWYV
jgi:L-amino acid N-acyltransferase YncA